MPYFRTAALGGLDIMLKVHPTGPVPAETARIAHQIFLKSNQPLSEPARMPYVHFKTASKLAQHTIVKPALLQK